MTEYQLLATLATQALSIVAPDYSLRAPRSMAEMREHVADEAVAIAAQILASAKRKVGHSK